MKTTPLRNTCLQTVIIDELTMIGVVIQQDSQDSSCFAFLSPFFDFNPTCVYSTT
ncbi:MAG: hypothetical protein ACRC10_07785 [Thermoguttaceae bacterium]